MTVYVPPFLSEFPDVAIVADCVPATGVMLADKVTHGRYPASVAEREALQNAMGTQDVGASTAQLQAGMTKRYALSLPIVHGWAAIRAALTDPRKGVSIIGPYPRLPAWIREHGNQPGFTGIHCIYAQGDGLGGGVVGDPLASTMLRDVDLEALESFASAADNGALVATEAPVIVAYRIRVAGRFTAYKVARWTHLLYSPLTVTFASTGSSAPVRHGSRGFWAIDAGPLAGRYAVYGRSPSFEVWAIYSNGARVRVAAGS